MNLDLKPCPFCGADAGFYVNNGVRVMCRVCRAQTMTLSDANVSASGGAVKRVADKWNQRTEESLKEQSSVFVENGFFRCGKCHAIVCRSHKFCHECGVKINWKEEDHADDD